MADLIALTELDAVNLMLESVGEQPVNTLVDTGIADVEIAQNILHNTSRNLQVRGWTFNNEIDYPLVRDVNNNIQVPTNVLKVRPKDTTMDIIQRGGKLYDKTNHTDVFTKDVKCDITFFLDFTDLPQAARTYIYVLASRDFQKKVLGSDTLTSITKEDEEMARVAFLEAESDVGCYNIFDSYDTARPLLRHQNPIPRGGW